MTVSRWFPRRVDLTGRVSPSGIKYLGEATEQDDGTWRVLASVPWAGLCIVEVSLTFPEAT
jgi:hypothetical protein